MAKQKARTPKQTKDAHKPSEAPVSAKPAKAAKPAKRSVSFKEPLTTTEKAKAKQSAQPPKPSRKRSAREEDSDDEKEDFGDVALDMNSDEEEGDSLQNGATADSESDEEDDLDFEADINMESSDEEELGEEEEEEEEIIDDDEEDEADIVDDDESGLEEEEDSDEEDRMDMDRTPDSRKRQSLPLLPEIEANYDSDSSTEETENTIGNVPLEWYKDLPHIGYAIDGKRILKPATGDELDKFLSTMDDPDSWKTVRSDVEGKDIVLNDEEMDIIQRLQAGEITDAGYNPYEPTVEFFSSKTEVMPISARPEPKRRFVPSKWEAKKIMKIVRAIRAGRIVPRKPKDEKPRFYNLWGDDDTPREDHVMHIPAPKMALPKHLESYNPPPEYIPDEAEIKRIEARNQERGIEKSKSYRRYKNLRSVPAYDQFIQERFKRCLDLYLAPRVRKNRLNVDPESLIPKLPSPKDLQPFPTHESISYVGHTGRIRCVSIHPAGFYALSGSDDGTLRLWEVATGRCLFVWRFEAVVQAVAWNPNPDLWLFGVSLTGGEVLIISPPKFCTDEVATYTDNYVKDGFSAQGGEGSKHMTWAKAKESEESEYGYKLRLEHTHTVKQITWHRKGDYFATVATEARERAVLIHQLTKHQSQAPFRRVKGLVQKVAFHPIKPMFFVVTQQYVRIFDLMQQHLVKTLQPNARWCSSIDVHPGGDNVLIGTYDKRVSWFDLDLGKEAYKNLRFHKMAVRQVVYHKRYPLFASASDDGTIQVFHGMVYNDLLQNPLIVPVKILRGHTTKDSLGVLDIQFHPTQPWILSTGADGTMRLWT